MEELERQGIIRRLSVDAFGHVHINNPSVRPSQTLCINRFGYIQFKNQEGSDKGVPNCRAGCPAGIPPSASIRVHPACGGVNLWLKI